MRRTSCGSVIDLIMQIQEEHGMPSNKHYEIPFVRSIPCSSLHHIQLITATRQNSIKSETLVFPLF